MNDFRIEYTLEPNGGTGPDARLHCQGVDGSILTSAGLWWRRTPADPDGGGRIGCVGNFTCEDLAAGVALLKEASRRLTDAGCARVVGPMDGDTWHKYRLVSRGWEDRPKFFLEPWNPPEFVRAFEQAGFVAWAHFSSSALAIAEPDDRATARHERLLARLSARGVTIRPLCLDAFEDELGRLFDLSLASFTGNFLYTPIDREAFLELYRPVREYVSGDFVLLAEKEGEAIGFVFAVPDVLHPEADCLIIKTLAVHPGFRHLGLGSILVEKVQHAARAQGFREVIHALQHEDNSVNKITQRNAGHQIRQYTLYHRSVKQS